MRFSRLVLPYRFMLALILLAAACVRFAGIGWGANHYLHPDERFITMVLTGIQWPDSVAGYFDTAQSPLNPANNGFGGYLYGTLPLFLTMLLGDLTGNVAYGDAHLPGRWLSAAADLGSVALVYWIGRRLVSPVAGLIAATLLAFTPLHIQAAHFTTTDAVAAFFAVASFATVLQAWSRRTWWWYALAGLCVGLAASSKPNLLICAGFLLLPALETVRIRGMRGLLPLWKGRRGMPVVAGVVLSSLVALATFRIAQPYSFVGPHPWNIGLAPLWTDTLRYWREVQAGYIDTPPGIQWADRTPVVFILDNLVRWGMGPALGIVALAGLAVILVRMATGRRWPSWWLLGVAGWVAWHIGLHGTSLVKAQRYLLPAYPFLIILAAAQLDAVLNTGRAASGMRSVARLLSIRGVPRPEVWRRAAVALTILVISGTVFSGLAFTSIYLRPHTRVAASEWIYEHIPPGSVIAVEHWDDALPLRLPDHPTDAYTGTQLPWYDADTEGKLSRVIGQLHRADYIILTSDRLIGSITREPDRYPMTTAYYDALVSGELGFEQVASFQSPPSLLGVTLDDRGAEESFTVYDHPYVRIFRKTEAWSTHDAWYFLDDALGDGGVSRRTIDPSESQMMLDPEERAEYTERGTWSAMFDPAGMTNALPVLAWYLALLLFALPAVPILWHLFPSLPDRGYALARTVGLFGVAWIAWVLASLRVAMFGPTAIWIALAIVVAIGGLAVGRHARALAADLRARWRWVVATEAIFLVTFLAMLAVRMQNPDLWHPLRGGEKPMELAMFNAILRSPWFPPYDPWFAGGTLHYYYFGYVPWAVVTRLTGILPEVAFNLAIPTIAALVAITTWSAAGALLVHLRPTRSAISGWRPILLALVAPVMVVALGNLDFVRRLGRGEWAYPAAPAWAGSAGDAGHILWGIRNALLEGGNLPPDAYWAPSRVIPFTINEFPYFTFLFGDLHAHMLAMPITAAVIATAIGIATGGGHGRTSPTRILETFGGWARAVPLALLVGFLPSLLIATNTWDYPPALAIIGVAVVAQALAGGGLGAPWPAFRDATLFMGIVLASGRLAVAPFLRHYGSLPAQVLPGTETTALADYLTIHGLMLFAIAGWLAIELFRAVSMLRSRFRRGGRLAIGLVLALGGVLMLAVVSGSTSVFLLAGLGTVAACGIARYRQPAHLTVLGMIGLAFGLALVPEFIRFGNDIGRMNLVFKLYLHTWQLLGVSAAISAVMTVFAIRQVAFEQRSLRNSAFVSWSRLFTTTGRVWLAALAVLVIGAATFPLLVTGPRVRDRFTDLDPTLDGLAYMHSAEWTTVADGGDPSTIPLANDLAAIDWLRSNVIGSPVVLEGQLPAYQWGGRISSTTGLPTVLGWTWHEIQQRPGYSAEVQRRVEDIDRIYGGFGDYAEIRPILERYGVQLIYVGDLERALYPAAALDKFEDAEEMGQLEMVYDASGVTIYAMPEAHVIRSREG